MKSRCVNSFASLRLCVVLFLLTAFCLLPTVAGQTRDFARWVNPFIGTGGHGHTFPGATVPFGMVQLSPDTRGADWDGSSGYHYSDDIIYGFSHTHLSGTGIPDYCDILIMPAAAQTNYAIDSKDTNLSTYRGYPSSFSHADEKAEPGFYSVRLDDRQLLAELTATKRVGLHRYTFPKSNDAGIFLDLLWRDDTIDAISESLTNAVSKDFGAQSLGRKTKPSISSPSSPSLSLLQTVRLV